ncbi:MAG TPA: hypothetical protein DCG12_14565 [Planctomycetaceae bacterium]|nr:hypothetical protein [Planctomycetaceae bacterium]
MLIRVSSFLVLISLVSSAWSDDRTVQPAVGLRENPPSVYALINARVVVPGGRELENTTVVIRDGLIHSVKPGGIAPADAKVIDLSGRTVYPGLIDAYSEASLPSDHLENTAGHWNSQVTPQLSAGTHVEPLDDRETLRKQGIVAVHRAPADGIIRGTTAVVSTGDGDAGRLVLADRVAQQLELTASQRSRTTYPGSPMGAVSLARQSMYDAQWYAQALQVAQTSRVPRPDINDALAALVPVVRGKQPILVETSDEQFALRADIFAREFGLRLILRGSGSEYRRINEVAATGRPVIVPLNFPDAPNVSTPEIAAGVTLESMMHWDLAPENPAKIHEAGITMALTTHGLSSKENFLKQVRKAVERGLPKEAALDAMTIVPAQLTGTSHLLGTIAPGRLASFFVTDGDLFEADTKIVETWVGGQRTEYDPAPVVRPEGIYELRMKGGRTTNRLFLNIKRDGSSVSAEVSKTLDALRSDSKDEEETKDVADEEQKADEKQSVDKFEIQDFAATGQFKEEEGRARFSLIFDPRPQPKQAAALGRIVWPDGAVSTATVTPVTLADSETDEPGEESEEDSETNASSFPVNYPLGAFGRSAAPEAASHTVFVNATIWTCGPQRVIRGGMLYVHNGKIVGVGKRLVIPDGAIVIDAKGMHITPGIIDCHSHMATDGGVNEGTQAITCEVRIGDFIDDDDITIYRQLAGGVTTSNILHGSANPIGGQNQVIKLRWGQTGEQMKYRKAPPGVKFALGENVKQSNWGDEYTTRYPQTRMGVEQLFRDAFTAAREYGSRRQAWQRTRRGLPVRRDLELDALLEMVEHKRWIHCHSYRQDEILGLIRVLDEQGIRIGTFQHILEGYKVADEMAKHGAMASAFADWWAYKFEVYDAIPYGGALMHHQGLVVSFNSDDRELGTRLNQEAAKAVRYGGVSPEEALKFVTLNPARQLRIDRHTGSLDRGKDADIVVWNGPPLSAFSRVEQTWIDGRRWFSRDEDQAARKQIAEMRNTLVQKILTSGEKMKKVGEKDADPSAQWARYDEFCRASGHSHSRQQIK